MFFQHYNEFEGIIVMKYIQTVTGKIPVAQMGKVTTHEHIFIKHGRFNKEEAAKSGNEWMAEKVSLENRGKIMYNLHLNRDNTILDDEDLMAQEVLEFKKYGGDTIVDVSCYGLGYDIKRLKHFSERTGVNIIASTGIYTMEYMPERFIEMSEGELTELFIQELTEGVDGTDIKAGCIGEIGVNCEENQLKYLLAAAKAQKTTGAALIFHKCSLEHLDILDSVGVDMSKVIVGHRDEPRNDGTKLTDFLDRGVNIALDRFGLDTTLLYKKSFPNDAERINTIRFLFDKGYQNQIVIGHDICFKVQLKKFGGFGYSHFFENVSRVMCNNGFAQEEIDILTVKNPARIFTLNDEP